MKINKHNILTENKKTGQLILGGEVMTLSKLEKLAGEAELLKTLEIWEIFRDTTRTYAVETGFLNATTLEQFREGKMLEYAVSMLETLVNTLEKKNKSIKK